MEVKAIDMTRAERLTWAKNRAIEYIDSGDLQGAFASMVSDLGKHPETANHIAIPLGAQMLFAGLLSRPEQMREFIEGFN